MQAVGGGLSGLAAQFSDESALQACIHVMRYTNRRLYFFLLLLYYAVGIKIPTTKCEIMLHAVSLNLATLLPLPRDVCVSVTS